MHRLVIQLEQSGVAGTVEEKAGMLLCEAQTSESITERVLAQARAGLREQLADVLLFLILFDAVIIQTGHRVLLFSFTRLRHCSKA